MFRIQYIGAVNEYRCSQCKNVERIRVLGGTKYSGSIFGIIGTAILCRLRILGAYNLNPSQKKINGIFYISEIFANFCRLRLLNQ